MILCETNFDEITTVIRSLKNKRRTGPFGISIEIPKLCFFIEPQLCKIVNKSMKEQIISDCLKNTSLSRHPKKVINFV